MGSTRILGSAVALLATACAATSGPPVPEGATVRRLATDMGFTEGPVWLADREAVVFSDIPNARLMLWSDADGLSVYRESENANGNALDGGGRLLSCQHGARNIVREEADGALTVLVDRFMGKRLNSPNDVAVQADGVLWFTDPPWGLTDQREGKELPGHWVFRFDERRGDLRLALNDLAMPNGIALSPDESRLYVADTGGHPSHPDPRVRDLPATLSAYALEGGEMVSTRPVWRVETRCDGMCVDAKGNVYATGDGAVTIWSRGGEPVGEIPIPEVPANCCFGGPSGRTLFVTARTSLYAIELRHPGAGL
ncbi:MAG: SMP-30/gluconolactonase/LRE family protein [Planctomycetota bacterium]